jgi:MoaA/NifB/PqqE/SkfB family radical SAM enzyme
VYPLLREPRLMLHALRHTREARRRPDRMRTRPFGLEIELTNRCNLACIQCLRSLGLKPYALGDIRREDFARIVAQFPEALNIVLNGFGEPLLHREFLAIVADTRAARPWAKLGIYSNGLLLTPALSRELLRSGLTEILVSIDAATPETYRKVRRGGKLEVLHDNLRAFIAARRSAGLRRPLLGVNFVMLNENEGELVPFVEQAHALGADFVNCITYAGYDWGFVNRRSPDSYRRELAAARARLDQLGLPCRSFPSDDLSWTAADRRFDCDFFWGGSVRISYSGELLLGCCTPFREQYTYGNLLDTPFDELWNSPALIRNRQQAREHTAPNAVCASCVEYGKRFFAGPELVQLQRKAAKG